MRFISPPRPKSKIIPETLPSYEGKGWVVQRKFNGSRIEIYKKNDEIKFFGRLGQDSFYEAPDYTINELNALNFKENTEYWLDGEFLDAKTKNPKYKNKIILYDVLYCEKYLLNVGLKERLDLLNSICNFPSKREPNIGIALQVTPNIWMAETFYENFSVRFEEFIQYDEIEGLVLKKLDSVLDNFGNSEYEVDWQIRCRKPHKNYGF